MLQGLADGLLALKSLEESGIGLELHEGHLSAPRPLSVTWSMALKIDAMPDRLMMSVILNRPSSIWPTSNSLPMMAGLSF